MVCAKRTAILPLGITGAIAFTNGNPTVSAYRLPRSPVLMFKPRNHQRRFWFELTMRDIVVGQRTVKGVLLGNKSYWNVIPPSAGIRGIGAAVILRPIKVPGAFVVWNGVVATRLFSDPKNSGHDIGLPRITLHRRTRASRDKNLRLHLEQSLLPKFHCVLRKVGRRRIRGSGLLVPEDFRGASNRENGTSRKKSPHLQTPPCPI
jgi:hypothetical protein